MAGNYPKIRAELKLLSLNCLPVYEIHNESDKLTANDVVIEISITNWMNLRLFKSRWITYTHEKLARLKPLDTFVPSDLSSDELSKWLNDREHRTLPISLKAQNALSIITLEKKSYAVRLVVSYTSNMFRANKVCRVVKKYRLTLCSNSKAINERDKFYWRLRE
ncbi:MULTISPECIES: hypothetical protein [Trichocoleus]|uniref:Uncharacterized protein n=1 Tax=Trichocoleus desertorum GB2-A4 TaxID=2933944 RepID=A0ABV0JG74_9CYAN|nr:hypothetical protein [Trichocoleus sp. FACHB-46]MBD1865271.1 hypothetical protein [Trichocoleus sp. FACHB-46]